MAYLEGGGLRLPPPFQLTIIFYDGIFGRFTNFFSSRTSKFRHSLTKKRQLLDPPGYTAITFYRDGHFGDTGQVGRLGDNNYRRLSDKNESFSLEQP